MSECVLSQNVTPALISSRWVDKMSDQMRTIDTKGWITTIAAVFAAAMVAAGAVFGGGGFFNDTRGGISRLEEQNKAINSRLDAIGLRLENGPRPTDMADLARANAQQDGRIDALQEAFNRRIGDLEKAQAATSVSIQNMITREFSRPNR